MQAITKTIQRTPAVPDMLICVRCKTYARVAPVGATGETKYVCPNCSEPGIAKGANLDRSQFDDFNSEPAQSRLPRGIQHAACRAAWAMTQPHLEFLPKRQQIIFFMSDVLGMGETEVGEYLKLAVGSVSSAVKRARKKLKSFDDTGKPLSAIEKYQHALRIDQDQLLRGAAIARDDPDPAGLVRFMHVARGKRRGLEKGQVTVESLTDC